MSTFTRKAMTLMVSILITIFVLPIALVGGVSFLAEESIPETTVEELIDPSEWFVIEMTQPIIVPSQTLETYLPTEPTMEDDLIEETTSAPTIIPTDSFEEIEWYSDYRVYATGIPVTEIYGEPVDREFLAKLLFAEAGGEGWLCQLYTCSAIINHCEASKMTLWECGHDDGHFAVAPYVDTVEPNELTYEVVDYVLRGGLIENICFFRTNYYHRFGQPVCKISVHCFSME